MKWGAKITLGMLVVSVAFSTAILGKNLWMQEKEQRKFEDLKDRISVEKEKCGLKVGVRKPGNKSIGSAVGEEKEVLPEYQEISKENPDFAGWISIEGTHIDYPVMQTPGEPEYYLHRNFSKEYSYAGVPFAGTGNLKAGEGDFFVYGHNMRNGTMYADLLKYQKKEFWKEHPVIMLDTLWEHRKYQIFAVFYANEKEWVQEDGKLYQILYHNGINKMKAVRTLKEVGEYDTGVIPEPGSSLLFLVTCSYRELGSRFVVAGVLKEKA